MSPASTGRLEWIGLRPERKAPVQVVEEAEAVERQGLVGDRFVGRAGGQGTRQVTVVHVDHLARVAERLGRDGALDPTGLRRNLLVSGVDLEALRRGTFRVGEALLQGTGGCPPCDRMESTVGPGARDALDGLAGITARVLRGGRLRVGDAVELLPDDAG